MAGRPRKSDEERLEDAFYDMNLADQDRMLDKLNLLHRLKRRNSSERFAAPAKDSENSSVKLSVNTAPLLDGLERPFLSGPEKAGA